jgi:hypothetical protein
MIQFITPLYRYNNIKIIYSSLKHQIDDFNWHLIEGSNKIGEESLNFLVDDERIKFYKIETKYIWGHEQRNFFIKNIICKDEDWCYFLDDDNIITWDLIKTYNEEKNSNTDLILFSQKKGLTEQNRLLGHKTNLKLGGCDIGSFLIRYRFIKKTKIHYIENRNGDGHFANQINEFKDKHVFKFYPERYVRYNALSLEIT